MRRFAGALMVAIALAAAAGLAACGGDDDSDAPTPPAQATATATQAGDEEVTYYGVRVMPPIPKPAFTLIDQDGEPYDIVAETEGQVVLLYIGYTNCPDVCPTHLADMAAAMKLLPEDVQEHITVVFVTADPARDTPEVLKRYLALFDERFVGLTGEKEDLDNLQRSVGIAPATTTDLGGGNYAVNHAAYVMAYTAEDNLAHIVYPLGFTREQWAHDLEKLVTEGWVEDEGGG